MSYYAFYANAYANATTAQTALLPVVSFVSSSLSSFKKNTHKQFVVLFTLRSTPRVARLGCCV